MDLHRKVAGLPPNLAGRSSDHHRTLPEGRQTTTGPPFYFIYIYIRWDGCAFWKINNSDLNKANKFNWFPNFNLNQSVRGIIQAGRRCH